MFRILAVVSIVFLMAGTSIVTSKIERIINPQNIMIVLDISRSMLAEDMNPSRMTVAKNSIKTFIQNRKNDNIWLIIFAGKPFLLVNNSNDTEGIEALLETIHPDFILQEKPWLSGTNIGDALLLAETELWQKKGEKSIILITDGSANIGSNPLESASESAKNDISIYTIGVGVKNNEPIFYTDSRGQKTFFYDQNGKKIKSDLDDALLIQIAKITDGAYYSAENTLKLSDAFASTESKLVPTFSEKKNTKQVSLTPILLIIFCVSIFGEQYFLKKFLKKYRILDV